MTIRASLCFVATFVLTALAPPPAAATSLARFAKGESASWMLPRVATSQSELAYVSYITGVRTGQTAVYEITASGATLVGTLNRGGGGPVAVDGQQNVYIVQADYGNGFYERRSTVLVYPRGGTKPSRKIVWPHFGAWAGMTVGVDGTVYMAGQRYIGANHVWDVVKFPPGSGTPQLLSRDRRRQPIYSTGLTVDAAGNLFAGWLNAGNTGHYDVCDAGCIEELRAGDTRWRVRLPDLGAYGIGGGPLVRSDGSLVFYTGGLNWSYIVTVPAGSKRPSGVIQLQPGSGPSGGILAFDATGSTLWMVQIGLSANNTVYQIAYPSGTLGPTFTVTNDPAWPTGFAVSPAYFP